PPVGRQGREVGVNIRGRGRGRCCARHSRSRSRTGAAVLPVGRGEVRGGGEGGGGHPCERPPAGGQASADSPAIVRSTVWTVASCKDLMASSVGTAIPS